MFRFEERGYRPHLHLRFSRLARSSRPTGTGSEIHAASDIAAIMIIALRMFMECFLSKEILQSLAAEGESQYKEGFSKGG